MKVSHSLVAVLFATLLAASARADFLLLDPHASIVAACRAAWVGAWPMSTVNASFVIVETAIQYANANSARVRDRAGAIVLRDSDWRTVEVINEVKKFQEENASALILATLYSEPGRAVWPIQERVLKLKDLHLRIPVFQVTMENCSEVFDLVRKTSNGSLLGSITTEDLVNPFYELSHSSWMIAIYLAFIIPPVVGIILVLYRLIPRLRYRGFELSLPYVVLSLELVSHVLRLVFAIDPQGMNMIFDPFNSLFWYIPHVSASIICHFIVLFYWNRAMNSFGAKPIEWLQKYLFALYAFVFVLIMVAATLSALDLLYAILVASQFFMVILEIAVVCYIIYTLVGLFKYLRDTRLTKRQERAKEKVMRMARLVITTAILLTFLFIFTSLGLISFFRKALSEVLFWIIQFGVFSAISICETLVMKPVTSRFSVSATNWTNRSKPTRSAHSGSSAPSSTTSSGISSISMTATDSDDINAVVPPESTPRAMANAAASDSSRSLSSQSRTSPTSSVA